MSTRQSRSGRRYLIRFGSAAVIYTALMLICLPLARSMPESPWRFVLACLPAVGIAIAIWALWRYLKEADELQTRKLLEALAFSVAGTVLISFCYGMMEILGAPRLGLLWATPIWAILFGIGTAVSTWKYR